MTRLLALVQKPLGTAPHQRFRHEQWAPWLNCDHGINLHFTPFESKALTELLYRTGGTMRKAQLVLADAMRRWRSRKIAAEYDGVVVLREAMLFGGPWIERYLAGAGIPFIYDFDDTIWRWSASGPNGLMTLARAPWKVAEICRRASAVTVGNEYLAAYARRHNRDVTVVYTSIDMERYPEIPEPGADQPFTVVWTGSHSTLAHLDTVRTALERLGSRRPVRLRVVCDRPPAPFENVTMEFVPWRSDTEAEDLGPSHVGIMPLPDTPYTRGKCGCKALQYMAIGRPTIVSPVGINREIVRDRENGLWAGDCDEWETSLSLVADNPSLRARLGAAGRATVLERYNARSSAAAFASVVRRVVGRR